MPDFDLLQPLGNDIVEAYRDASTKSPLILINTAARDLPDDLGGTFFSNWRDRNLADLLHVADESFEDPEILLRSFVADSEPLLADFSAGDCAYDSLPNSLINMLDFFNVLIRVARAEGASLDEDPIKALFEKATEVIENYCNVADDFLHLGLVTDWIIDYLKENCENASKLIEKFFE